MDVRPLVPVYLPAWLDSVRPELQPPVGNKMLFGAGQLQVMVVGGPNERRDFHIEAGEELFLQLEGDMTLELAEGRAGAAPGATRAVPIREGQAFLLSAHTPHSPRC